MDPTLNQISHIFVFLLAIFIVYDKKFCLFVSTNNLNSEIKKNITEVAFSKIIIAKKRIWLLVFVKISILNGKNKLLIF